MKLEVLPYETKHLSLQKMIPQILHVVTSRNARLKCPPLQIGDTAFDEWNCRADVACVGADLRVRPQNRLRSGEDRQTHKFAPTVEAPTPTSGSPEEKSTELPKREKTSLFTCM